MAPQAGAPGAIAALAVVLMFALSPAIAQGAPPGVSPDPAPKAAPSSGTSSPAPDPAPQASPEHAAAGATSTVPAAPVLPTESAGGIDAVSPGSQGSATAAPTTANVVQTPRPAPRPERRGRPQVHRRLNWSAIFRRVTGPWRQKPAGIDAPAVPRLPLTRRNGMLLLLGAVALAVLALASASMLKLLRRMDEGVSPL